LVNNSVSAAFYFKQTTSKKFPWGKNDKKREN
jgi:hypothetical protein